jgi:restriction system protein
VDTGDLASNGPSWYREETTSMSLLLLLDDDEPITTDEQLPGLLLKAVIVPGADTGEGKLIEAVALPWFAIINVIRRDPTAVHQIGPRKWEEIIAGAYERAGFDEVILTPPSRDKGRDVVATKNGIGSIRIFDQVKAYSPGNLVTAEEVRSLLGVVTAAGNVSKGIVTTTSNFAPTLTEDAFLKTVIPYRIELKARDELLRWLAELAKQKN